MDIETAKLAFQILQFLITGGIAVYVYLASKDRVTNERINGLENDLDGKFDNHGERIARLETHGQNAPTHSDLGDLHNKVNTVDLKVSAQGGKLDAIDATLRMILSRITERGMP